MKKILLLTMLFAFVSALSAQITQERADEIVLERINQETQPYIVYAKEGVQTETTITTTTGEILELDYSCWVYYASDISVNCFCGFYLIVNESNGNLLEVKTKNATPEGLAEWTVLDNCGKNGINDDLLYIHAKIENAAQYSNVAVVKLMGVDVDRDWNKFELTRGDWKDDGFTIELPKTVTPNYLYPLINTNGLLITIVNPPATMTISNENVKIGNAYFWGFDNEDRWVVDEFYPFKMINGGGNSKSVFLTYVDSDVIISGYTEGSIIYHGFDEATGATLLLAGEITTTYSINWKKGWNVWSYSQLQNGSTFTEQWTSISVCELEW